MPQAHTLDGFFQIRHDVIQVFGTREVSVVATVADADHWLGSGRRVYPTATLVRLHSIAIRNKRAPADLQQPRPENAFEMDGAPLQCGSVRETLSIRVQKSHAFSPMSPSGFVRSGS
jgi:hypothetical protein